MIYPQKMEGFIKFGYTYEAKRERSQMPSFDGF